jgi:predicted transcriptional regulator
MRKPKKPAADPDMLPEYNFSNAVRGKYAGRMPKNPRIHLLPGNTGAIVVAGERRDRVRAIRSKVREIRRKMDELEELIRAEETVGSGR